MYLPVKLKKGMLQKTSLFAKKPSIQMCKSNLEGMSFYAKGGRVFCKEHAARR